jgi:hypothetical protein
MLVDTNNKYYTNLKQTSRQKFILKFVGNLIKRVVIR